MKKAWALSSQKGFTIVELLIVIVVIAVLAAIVTVTYSGIQTKANNTQTITAVSSYVRALQAYAIDHGTYPAAGTCIGESYDTSYCLSTEGVNACYSLGGLTISALFHDALRPYMGGGQLPMPSQQKIACGGESYAGASYFRVPATGVALIHILLKGDISCPDIGGLTNTSKVVAGEGARCTYNMPAP